MNIGELKEKSVKNGKILVGQIATLEIDLSIELIPLAKRDNSNAPTYAIYARNISGTSVQIGAAWVRTMKRGANIGEEFLSITIEDPSLRHSLNVAAFKNHETGNWDVVYRRRQEKAA